MMRFTLAALAAVCLAAPLAAVAAAGTSSPVPPFSLTSPEIVPGGRLSLRQVYNGFGCSGGNVSPALAWTGAPAGTKSFALTVYDPDAPTGSGWWHWVVIDIPPTTTALVSGAGEVASGKAPKGSQQLSTDFGKPGFGGACPPEHDKPHRYVFTLYALSVDKLGADPGATAAMAGFMINAHQLGKATFTAYYGR